MFQKTVVKQFKKSNCTGDTLYYIGSDDWGSMGILELLDPDDETRKILQNITTYLPGDMANISEDFKQETCV